MRGQNVWTERWLSGGTRRARSAHLADVKGLSRALMVASRRGARQPRSLASGNVRPHGSEVRSEVVGRRVLLAVADGAKAGELIDVDQVSANSVAVTAAGRPPERFLYVTVGDLLAGLVPESA